MLFKWPEFIIRVIAICYLFLMCQCLMQPLHTHNRSSALETSFKYKKIMVESPAFQLFRFVKQRSRCLFVTWKEVVYSESINASSLSLSVSLLAWLHRYYYCLGWDCLNNLVTVKELHSSQSRVTETSVRNAVLTIKTTKNKQASKQTNKKTRHPFLRPLMRGLTESDPSIATLNWLRP